MYKYSYEKIKCDISGWGPLNGSIFGTENYQKIINTKANDGWRYVGYIPTKQRGTGHIQEIELIFEKEIKESSKKEKLL